MTASRLFFTPWVGHRFRSEGLRGQRVLVLAEAHYGQPEQETPGFTVECVNELALVEQGHRFFTIIAKLLLDIPTGEALTLAQKRDLWGRIAFANYVQQFPGDRARIRPTPQMWADAEAALRELIDQVEPTAILVTGRELASRLPPLPPAMTRIDIAHPSSFGFPVDVTRQHVQDVLFAERGACRKCEGDRELAEGDFIVTCDRCGGTGEEPPALYTVGKSVPA